MSTNRSLPAQRALDVLLSWCSRVIRLLLRGTLASKAKGPSTATKLISAIAEESADTAATAHNAVLRLESLLPLGPSTLVGRYVQGSVPFGHYGDEERIYWRDLEVRGLITRDTARVSRRSEQLLKRLALDIRLDVDQEEIIRRCRRDEGTWLNEAMIRSLLAAAELGICTTIAAYQDGELVAGEFGLDLGGWYFGMSRFHSVNGAGSALSAYLLKTLLCDKRHFVVIDTGELKPHSVSLGARETTLPEFSARVLAHLGQTHPLPARRDPS
jgi:leucyl/phenylalanyl-tRNA--protein transferase